MKSFESLSPEAVTAVEMIEVLKADQRNYALEKLREIINEIQEEAKWDQAFTNNPEPMRKMARQALEAHENGKSWRF